MVRPVAAVVPGPTSRLRFRQMSDADLDLIADLLGDPEVMRYYPAPRTRDEAQEWIDWTRRSYAEHGYGLWVVETHDGEFVGDCGLTWQQVGEQRHLEVGYHVVRRCRAAATPRRRRARASATPSRWSASRT